MGPSFVPCPPFYEMMQHMASSTCVESRDIFANICVAKLMASAAVAAFLLIICTPKLVTRLLDLTSSAAVFVVRTVKGPFF